MGTRGPMAGNIFAALHPVPSLGTLHVSILFQGMPAPAIATTKLSPSLGMVTKQVLMSWQDHVACPWTQPHSRSLSSGTITGQVPNPMHSHTGCHCPRAQPHVRSPSGHQPSHGLLLQQTMMGRASWQQQAQPSALCSSQGRCPMHTAVPALCCGDQARAAVRGQQAVWCQPADSKPCCLQPPSSDELG